MADHQAAVRQESSAQEVGDFLRRRREQIAQRWADEALFRTVFTVSRDEAVEAGRAVVEALAAVAATGRVEDLGAAGFATVREQLGRMAASRARAGAGSAQIADEVAALRPAASELLSADLADAVRGRTPRRARSRSPRCSERSASSCWRRRSAPDRNSSTGSACSCWKWPRP